MEILKFANYQEEISIVEYQPVNYLKDVDFLFFDADYEELSIEEKLLIVVLDRDGFFFSEIKPSPGFLILLKRHSIYVEAFSFYNGMSKIYGVFLKLFIKSNPNHKIKNNYKCN
ncbi:MAG: hypothetical protein ABIP44_02390 [Pseudoxanthomonas sp.]